MPLGEFPQTDAVRPGRPELLRQRRRGVGSGHVVGPKRGGPESAQHLPERPRKEAYGVLGCQSAGPGAESSAASRFAGSPTASPKLSIISGPFPGSVFSEEMGRDCEQAVISLAKEGAGRGQEEVFVVCSARPAGP